jgi:hypothetical protein
MSAEKRPMGVDSTSRSLLRWYPGRWKARYADEFAAMIEDDLDGRPPTMRYRWSIARSGLHEHLRQAGVVGDSVSPSERIRGGTLTVLCAFALFVIPGVGFAKISEHWDQSIHQGPRHLPAASFNVLASLAGGCTVAVLVAAAAVLPPFVQFVRAGGWPAIRRRVRWAVTATTVTAAATAGLAIWARHLTTHQRNAGFGWYQLLFVVLALMCAATVAAWSATAVTVTRRLQLGSRQLKVTGALAVSVAACMPLMTAAAAVWWGSMASTAPWFLSGAPAGSSSSPWATNLFGVLILMVIASAVGVIGLLRVIRSWRQLQQGVA